MSQFDVAAGISQQAINNVIRFLFDNDEAKEKLFTYQTTQTIPDLGDFELSLVINELPLIVFEAPTHEEWDAAIKQEKAEWPLANGFKLQLPSVTGTMTYDEVSTTATGEVIIICDLFATSLTDVCLKPRAILVDQTDFSEMDAELVNHQLVPALFDIVDPVLTSITIPAIPAFEGVELQPVAFKITGGSIVLASSLKTNPATNISDYTLPSGLTSGVYTEVSSAIPNVLLNKEVKGQTFGDEDKTGPNEWSAGYKIAVTVADLSLDLSDEKITAKLTPGNISAKGEVTGLGIGITKSVLCPVTTAIDAMVDPDNWDKLTASFAVSITPKEASVVAEAKLVTVKVKDKDVQKVRLKVVSTNEFAIRALPTWSGSIVGTVMATATSALVDMIPKSLDKLIVDKIITNHLQSLDVYSVPVISNTIAGVKISIGIPDNSITVSTGKTIVQQLEINAVHVPAN
ncbi:hypothetical protein [Mucilaginibacter celer]|uniref:DUF4403 family protein n=1 Tax=Mucilaginibacter celer TaxID=2305508 RepID=A0A494VLL5_9SPHI|nr:hypothetical protein [Mucilaginibacter celer]AYL96147.1 hypothetical protein HYN43_012975 [Mucilaginibacter celer]